MSTFLARFRCYFPQSLKVSTREKARSVLGALIGIFLTGLLSKGLLGAHPAIPWLVAPMGASAVLLFAVPASPLAQPWPVVGGNVICAMVGMICSYWVGPPVVAAAVAVCAAIAIMFALRCVHPPGGAVALSAALGGHTLATQGYLFAVLPIAVNSAALLAVAIAYNKLCGRRYPHFPVEHVNEHRTTDTPPFERVGIRPEDLDAALAQYNEALDISRDDLEEILSRTEMNAYQRRFGEVKCGDIMSHDVVKVQFETGLHAAWRLLRKHRIKALPVVNRFNRVIGIVTLHDFIKQFEFDEFDGIADKLRRVRKRAWRTHIDKPEAIGQIMTVAVKTASVHQPIVSLVPVFSDTGLHHLPVVDDNERLVGIVTQSDLIAALYQVRLGQAQERRRA